MQRFQRHSLCLGLNDQAQDRHGENDHPTQTDSRRPDNILSKFLSDIQLLSRKEFHGFCNKTVYRDRTYETSPFYSERRLCLFGMVCIGQLSQIVGEVTDENIQTA